MFLWISKFSMVFVSNPGKRPQSAPPPSGTRHGRLQTTRLYRNCDGHNSEIIRKGERQLSTKLPDADTGMYSEIEDLQRLAEFGARHAIDAGQLHGDRTILKPSGKRVRTGGR